MPLNYGRLSENLQCSCRPRMLLHVTIFSHMGYVRHLARAQPLRLGHQWESAKMYPDGAPQLITCGHKFLIFSWASAFSTTTSTVAADLKVGMQALKAIVQVSDACRTLNWLDE